MEGTLESWNPSTSFYEVQRGERNSPGCVDKSWNLMLDPLAIDSEILLLSHRSAEFLLLFLQLTP